MDTDNLPHMYKVLKSINFNESLESFGTEMGSRTPKPEIEGIHLHHKHLSN